MSIDIEFDDEWEYDAYRVGRVTRTVDVGHPDGGSQTIEAGIIRFDPINEEDQWLWDEDEWVDWMAGPDGGIGFEGGVAVPHDKLGVLEFPEPMTAREAHECLEENPDRWRQFLDEQVESDVTVSDIMEEIQ